MLDLLAGRQQVLGRQQPLLGLEVGMSKSCKIWLPHPKRSLDLRFLLFFSSTQSGDLHDARPGRRRDEDLHRHSETANEFERGEVKGL